MSYSFETKEKARELRKNGYSIKEIATMFNISKSTSSLWLRDVKVNPTGEARLKERSIFGQYKSREISALKRSKLIEQFNQSAKKESRSIKLNRSLSKLLCSIFFWTEGGKYSNSIAQFINSDPKMIKVFLILFRRAFDIDESKFRALVHIHNYHNDTAIKQFWSETTNIPISQFTKSYKKLNTGKRTKEGYQGCIRISYYDHKVALELRSIYNMLATKLGV